MAHYGRDGSAGFDLAEGRRSAISREDQWYSDILSAVREWREIARLDSTYQNYRQVAAGVLLMYGGRSDSVAVNLVVQRLPTVLPCCETKEFSRLDHFGIERTAPKEVARVVGDFFSK